MPNAKEIPLLSDSEEAAIQAGIAVDPENPEWAEAEMKEARPFAEVLPELAESIRRDGVQGGTEDEFVSLRLDPEVVQRLRATGPGWQSRINDVLKKAVGL